MGLTLTNEATNKVASFNHKQVKEVSGDYTVLPEDSFLVLTTEASQFGDVFTISSSMPVGAIVSVFNKNPDGHFNFAFVGSDTIEATTLTNTNFKTASIIKISSNTWKYIYGYKIYPTTAALEDAISDLLALIQENGGAISDLRGDLSTQEEIFNAFEQKVEEFENSINSGVLALEADIELASQRFDALSAEITALAGLTDLYNREIVAYSASEKLSRQQADVDILKSIADSAGAREELNRRRRENERLIDAAVYIDPDNGEIINRAFSFTEEYFTEASLRIDGVVGEINAAVQRIDLSENDIENLYSELSLLPGVITATAQSVVAQNISALTPAHSFNFFDSAQGWVAVRGTLTEDIGYISTTFGDIENTSLNYNGLEDPAIRVQCKRTAGTGFAGDIEITDSNNAKNYLSNVIPNDLIDDEYVFLIIDMEGFANYQKDITGLRLILGSSTDDEFDIKSIVVGKKDALLQEFNELTGRVTNAEFRVDAIEGQIEQKLDVTTFTTEGVTRSNVSSVLDGVNSYIELKALNQELTLNDTVTKANAAAIDIDALENTITQSVESFNAGLEGVDSRVTSALQEISELRIRQQIVGVGKSTGDYEQDVAFLNSLATQSLRDYVIQNDAKTAALAVEDLEVEISPTGSIGKRILDLESVSNALDGLIAANLREIQIVSTNLDGTTQAANQLELEVSKLNGDIQGALTEINSVKIDADNNAEAISGISQSLSNEIADVESSIQTINQNLITVEDDLSTTASALSVVEGKVNDGTTGLDAAYSLAQSASTSSNTNSNSITAIQNDINDLANDISLNATFAQQVKITADGNKTSITTIQNRLDDASTGLSALAQSIQGVEQDLEGTVTVLNQTSAELTTLDGNLTAVSNTLNGVSNTVDNHTTAINGFSSDINDLNSGVNANASLLQTVEATANDAASSITTISNRVTDVEDFAETQITLNSSYDESIDALVSRIKLVADSNGRIAGIDINNNGTTSSIDLIADALKFLDSSGNAKVYWDNTNNRYVFNGHIIAKTGEFEGDLSGNTITGATVIGSKIATSNDTSTRIEIEDDGTYLIWAGEGSKTDSNGTFWIKKNGTGYVKGSFFSGGIIESKVSSGTRTASHTHNSAGNDVEVTVNASGSSTTIAGSAPSGVGTTTYTRTIAIKRAGVIIKSIEVVVTRVVEYEAAEREYTTRDFFSFSTSFVDTGTSNTGYLYRVDVDAMPLSGASQEVTLKTYENILG
ncbi:tail-related protein [Alteromonas phage vB_AemP_PT15-A5]|nr:tail-related protein [Alteromonas phage vB_AemP_PT15-A5]